MPTMQELLKSANQIDARLRGDKVAEEKPKPAPKKKAKSDASKSESEE